MSRKVFLFLAMFLSAMTYAQTLSVGPAVKGQWSATKAGYKKFGWSAGVQGEMFFSKEKSGLFVDASVLFDSKKSESINVGIQNTSYFYKYNSYSINIPVNIGYKLKCSDSFSLFAAAGPYVDFGLCGKVKKVTDTYAADGYTKTEASKETTVSSNIYKDKVFNRVNCGIGFKIGTDLFQHYQIQAGYSLGLTKTFHNGGNHRNRQQTFFAGVVYMF